MSATLPPPQSVWRKRTTHRQMRVIYSAECEVIAHDAELHAVYPENIKISSWVGTAAEFESEFIPGDPTHFPSTAGTP